MNLQASNDNHPAKITSFAIIQFEVGKTYTCRSICDWDCIYSFTIVRRSEKTVTIKSHGKEVRRTIRVADGSEQIDPHGRYSMSPVLRAKPYGSR